MTSPFDQYLILGDQPAKKLNDGARRYAQLASQILLSSPSPFVLGIFGPWGAGKTSILEAAAAQLRSEPACFPVVFNAWRYESEPHVIVPLLDTLNDALVEWEDGLSDSSQHAALKQCLGEAISVVRRSARALLAGLSLRAGIGAASLTIDPNAMLTNYVVGADDASPASFYHGCFLQLRNIFEQLRAVSDDGLVVVLVDDLDRCMPERALAVLEAIKVFLDLPGVSFAVCVDHDVVSSVAEARYSGVTREARPSGRRIELAGSEYLQKICSAWIDLEPVPLASVDELLGAIVEDYEIPATQDEDIRHRIRDHLAYRFPYGRINPREVKHFINQYTMTMRLKPHLNPDAVLTLQTLSARADWADAYSMLRTYGGEYLLACKKALTRDFGLSKDLARFNTSLEKSNSAFPRNFLAYLDGGPAAAILDVGDLRQYFFRSLNVNAGAIEELRLFERLQRMNEELRPWRERPDTTATADSLDAFDELGYALAEAIDSRTDSAAVTNEPLGELSQAATIVNLMLEDYGRFRDGILTGEGWIERADYGIEELRMLFLDVSRRSGLDQAGA